MLRTLTGPNVHRHISVSVAQRLGRQTSDLAVMGSIPSPRGTWSAQPSIPPGSVNRVSAFTGWG